MADQPQSKDPNGPDAAYSSDHPTDPPPYAVYPAGPPQPGPPPPGIQVTTVLPGAVIIQQTVGDKPTHTTCRSCNQTIVTRVERKAATKTHIFAVVLCLIGCWPCICIPYCTDSCLNADHYCTNCGAFIGTYIR